MKAVCVVLFFISQFLLLVTGSPEFTNCPETPLCINELVTYQCRVDTNGADTLQWRVFNGTDELGPVSYGSGLSVGSMGSIGTQFTTNLTSIGGGSIVSNITFTATMDINNYTVECRAVDTSTPAIRGTETCSVILVEGELNEPTVSPNISAINPDNYTISWSPSTNRCIISYTVFINSPVGNSSFENVPVDTGLVVNISQPFDDTVYTISVAAVDTLGRQYRDPGEEIMLITDVPESVTDLILNQTGLSIDVSWVKPPHSSRPEILSYIINITDNVTNFDTSITIMASTTTHSIPDAIVGSVYTVGVAAVNVLGNGSLEFATISILNIVVTTSTSITGSSSTVTVTPPAPSSSSSSMGATVTPSTSSPTSTTAGGSNSILYIGIGVGLVVFGIVILVLVIVGCLVWHKFCKGEKANFDQRRDSTEPIALVDKKDHGSSPATGQPIYQEAMSSEDIQREAAPTTGELYAQPNKGSVRRPPPQPQAELATYQDPSTIQRTQAPNMEYLYAEVDKSKPQQQQAVYAQVDKDKKGGDGTVYADLDLKNTQGGPVTGSNPANVIYSDVHNN